MALIQFGTVVTDARGKVAGNFFSRNLGGKTLSRINIPTNIRLKKGNGAYLKQVGTVGHVARTLQYVSQYWRTLDDATREQWEYQALNQPVQDKWGNARNSSGFNLFVAVNHPVVYYGSDIIENPSIKVGSTQLATLAVHYNLSVLSTTALPVGNSDEVLIIEATRAISPGRKPSGNMFRSLGSYANAGIAIDITSAYIDKFGTIGASGRIWVRVYYLNNVTGEKSVLFSQYTDLT